MLLLTRGLPALIELGLLVYALIDCIQTPAEDQRNLPKPVWVLLVILVPVVGPIAWLVAGRPQRQAPRNVPWPSGPTAGFPEYERPGRGRRSVAPDDDPDFLASIGPDREREQLLDSWEADLRRREEQLRKDGPHRPDDAGPADRA